MHRLLVLSWEMFSVSKCSLESQCAFVLNDKVQLNTCVNSKFLIKLETRNKDQMDMLAYFPLKNLKKTKAVRHYSTHANIKTPLVIRKGKY